MERTGLDILTPQERLSLRLREIYEAAGFRLYRMGRFEEYGFYQEHQDFLESRRTLTFTDLDGRLMALKPDVTLSIAKNAPLSPDGGGRYYYAENVYRPDRTGRSFREIRQVGVERIGALGREGTAQILSLARATLDAAGEGGILEIGHMGFVSGLFDALEIPDRARGPLLEQIRRRDLSAVLTDPDQAGRIRSLSGDPGAVFEAAGPFVRNDAMRAALDELRVLTDALPAGAVRLDLSLVNDLAYYNGLVMQGFLPGRPRPVLKGGRYDPLAGRFRPGAEAAGFALYMDELDPLSETGEAMLDVALPKGRLGDQVLSLLATAGYAVPEGVAGSRKLVMEDAASGIRYFLVKPADVCAYVEHGAADVGIAGKDILEESGADVYELLDTGLGKCRMCVAAPEGSRDDPGRPLRVATKFVETAKRHYAARGREIDVIELHGSIELAPLLGLSDVIVDIVETGTTLRENGLTVREAFLPISARLIANRSSYRFKREAVEALAERLKEVAEG